MEEKLTILRDLLDLTPHNISRLAEHLYEKAYSCIDVPVDRNIHVIAETVLAYLSRRLQQHLQAIPEIR